MEQNNQPVTTPNVKKPLLLIVFLAVFLSLVSGVVSYYFGSFKKSSVPTPTLTIAPTISQTIVPTTIKKACTTDAKQCPDGSWVSRTGPNCEFTPCPTSANMPQEKIITGEVLIMRINEENMTIQLIANSNAGDIVEMVVWTNKNQEKKWQKFTTLITMPFSEHVYAQFKDEKGNISEVYSDASIPQRGPPPP